MLTIRTAQLAVLGADTRRAFIERVLAYCCNRHPGVLATVGDAAARTRIAAAVDGAPARGLEAGADIVRHAELSFLFGVDFEIEQEWAGAVLAETRGLGVAETWARLHVTGLAVAGS